MTSIWGKLTRNGGLEDSQAVPATISLTEKDSFFGRTPQPAPRGDQEFTHSSQIVIPCVYISSTQFSIHQEPSSKKLTIKDFSRNGTLLNGELIGANTFELHDNDVISLRYKDKIKISYIFNLVSESVPMAVVTEEIPISNLSQQNNPRKTSNHHEPSAQQQQQQHYPLKKTDSTSDLFTQQIANLQNEMKKLENKLLLTNEHLDSLTKENEKCMKKSKQDDKLILTLQKENEDLQDRFSSIESNFSALTARNSILQDSYDDLLIEMKEMKNKNSFYTNEIQEKQQSIDNLHNLLEESNKILSMEKRAKIHLETIIQDMKNKQILYEEKILRLTTANQALQDIVSELENDKNHLERIKEQQSAYITKITALSTSQRNQLVALENQLKVQIQHLLQETMNQLQKIDEIPLFSLDLMNNGGAGGHRQQNDDHHTLGIHPVDTLEESFHISLPHPLGGSGGIVPQIRLPEPSPHPVLKLPQPQQSNQHHQHQHHHHHQSSTYFESTQAGFEENDALPMDFYNTQVPPETELPSLPAISLPVPQPSMIPAIPQKQHPVNDDNDHTLLTQEEEEDEKATPNGQEQEQEEGEELGAPLQRGHSKINELEAPYEKELIGNVKDVVVNEVDPTLLSQESVIRKSLDTSNVSKLSDLTSSGQKDGQHQHTLLPQPVGTTAAPSLTPEKALVKLSQQSRTLRSNAQRSTPSSANKTNSVAPSQSSTTDSNKNNKTKKNPSRKGKIDEENPFNLEEDEEDEEAVVEQKQQKREEEEEDRRKYSSPEKKSRSRASPASSSKPHPHVSSLSHALSPNKLLLLSQQSAQNKNENNNSINLSQSQQRKKNNKRSRQSDQEEEQGEDEQEPPKTLLRVIEEADQQEEEEEEADEEDSDEDEFVIKTSQAERNKKTNKTRSNKKQKVSHPPQQTITTTPSTDFFASPQAQQRDNKTNSKRPTSSRKTKPSDRMEEEQEQPEAVDENPFERTATNASSAKSFPHRQPSPGLLDEQDDYEERQRTNYEF